MAKKQSVTPALFIKRSAIDPAGRTGSVYNGYHDIVLDSVNINSDKISERLFQSARCILLKHIQNSHPLEIINVDEQLRLSLLLNLTPKLGIAALINQSHVINEGTRILHYTYLDREETFTENIENIREFLPTNISDINATHIITNVTWGVDIIIVLQLPSDPNIITMIDQTLEKYQTYLNGERDVFHRTRDDMNSLAKILNTKIYSNISNLNEITTLHDLFHHISQLNIDDSNHQPLEYILYPLQSVLHEYSSRHHLYIPVDSIINTKLEQYLLELFISMKTLEVCFNENIQNLLCGHFKDRLVNVEKRWSIVQKEYHYILEEFTKLILEIRSGQVRSSTIDKKLRSKTQIEIQNSIENLTENVLDLNAKGHLISELGYQRIQYCNVADYNLTKNDNEEILKHHLMVDEENDRVLCSKDLFNEKNPNLFRELRRKLLDEYAKNIKLRLIYADFSYCNYPLREMMILSNRKSVKQNETISLNNSHPSISQSSGRFSTAETLNILLLGETGVGKSTFINALINYLTFQTLDKAQTTKPIIAIPGSFLINAGSNSDEYTIQFNDLNTSKSEQFDHPGQSATQNCRSYIYNLNEKVRIRFIGTPGFGDTRGLDQDNRNLQEIIMYIKKLNHLNAICFLFKSNESRLNIFFRSCVSQLYNLFGPNIHRNLLFCFTNTRSSFYTPGNTAVLLKNIFPEEISLKKKNTFCFDNEAFRYLMALQNQISFTNYEKQNYQTSWENSFDESYRFIRYIRKKLHPYPIHDEFESIKHLKIKIVNLTHPLIEAMRSILRNIIIRKTHSHHNALITDDNYEYQPLPRRPVSLDFLQAFAIINGPLTQKQDDMIDHLSFFCQISAELSYFLMHTANYRNGDPFLTGLVRLVKEETTLCEKANQNYMNLQLVDSLKKLTNHYEQCIQMIQSNTKQISLIDIHKWIKYINDYPFIADYVIDTTRLSTKDTSRVSIV